MFKIIKISTLTLFSLLLCFLTYRLCYFIAEKYFFDKLFYQKSIAHGYNSPKKEFNYIDYGKRSQDLATLENPDIKNILGITDDNSFKIAIIGDSHVWGQGIRNNQRFAKLLEDKLNKIRPTKIYSYGKQGNNILNYYNTYKKVSNILQVNLYIIVPVTNDAILSENDINDPIINLCQGKYPSKKPLLFSIDNSETKIIESAWINPINQCMVNESLKLLPANNGIYFIDKNYYRDNTQFDYYLQSLNKNNKFILSTEVGKYMEKYRRYFNNNVYSNFSISQMDPHPNTLANQMYADILFSEITTNPKWDFLK